MKPPDALRTITGLEPGEHLCWLYETEEEHRAVLTSFIRQGLEREEKVLYIVDAHTAETVLGYLRDDGLETDPRHPSCLRTRWWGNTPWSFSPSCVNKGSMPCWKGRWQAKPSLLRT